MKLPSEYSVRLAISISCSYIGPDCTEFTFAVKSYVKLASAELKDNFSSARHPAVRLNVLIPEESSKRQC